MIINFALTEEQKNHENPVNPAYLANAHMSEGRSQALTLCLSDKKTFSNSFNYPVIQI